MKPTSLQMSVVNRQDVKNHAKAFMDAVDTDKWEATDEGPFEDDAIVLPGKGENQNVSFSELDIITQFMNRVADKFVVADRDIVLRGLKQNYNQIVGWIANFKKNEVSGSADIRVAWDAEDTDIALDILRPPYLGYDNWDLDSVTAGPNNFVTQDGEWSIPDDAEVFFTGDLFELSSNALITQLSYESVDGKSFRSIENYLETRGTDLQYSTVPGCSAKSTLDLRVHGRGDGDTELVPLMFVIAEGDVTLNDEKIGTLSSGTVH